MGIGTQAPVGHQDVASVECGMKLHRLGEVMGAQGSTQHLQHHTGTRMKQRHQVGDWKPTPGLLPSRLAKVLLQLGGIGHRKTRAVSPKGAMAKPASLIERLVLQGVPI